jgi:hypothetical protein
MLNERTFTPGDTIFLSKDCFWFEHLSPKGSGKEGKPIVITSYGAGNMPLLIGNPDKTGEGVFNLTNQSWWEISNIEIINEAPLAGDRRGVQIKTDNIGVVSHIHLKNLNIHHIKGIPGNGTKEKKLREFISQLTMTQYTHPVIMTF